MYENKSPMLEQAGFSLKCGHLYRVSEGKEKECESWINCEDAPPLHREA